MYCGRVIGLPEKFIEVCGYDISVDHTLSKGKNHGGTRGVSPGGTLSEITL